jgi:hypothetical protein
MAQPVAPIVSAPPSAPVAELRVPERASKSPDFETPPISSAFGDGDRIADRTDRHNALSNPNLRKVVPSGPPATAAPLDVDVASLEQIAAKPLSVERNTEPNALLAHGPPALRKGRANPSAAAPAAPPAVSRPTSRFAAVPAKSASSIFGDGVISEQSLDEVILSYLAEDLDGSSE